MKKHKILLVSWSILPNKGGTSVIVENLAKSFTKDEMVVFGSRQPFQKIDLKRDGKGPKYLYFPSELYFFGRGYRYLVWFRRWRFKPLIEAIKRTIKEEGITYVIGVYPNPFYMHAACIAAKELGLPFSSYFHNTYTDNIAITAPEAPEIQKEVFDYSEHIFVMSKGMKKFYEERYGLNNFIPLTHTFHAYPDKSSYSGLPGTEKSTYRLVAIGNFNESNLDATIRFVNAIKEDSRFELSLFTHVPRVLLQQRGVDTSAITHAGFVTPEEVHDKLQNYDICVLSHGFEGGYGEVEYKTIFPTRTIPFLLSGKPIIVHSPKGSFLNDFIQDNKCAELIDEPSEEKILQGLERIINSEVRQKELVDNASKTAELFYHENVVAEFKKLLSKTN